MATDNFNLLNQPNIPSVQSCRSEASSPLHAAYLQSGRRHFLTPSPGAALGSRCHACTMEHTFPLCAPLAQGSAQFNRERG